MPLRISRGTISLEAPFRHYRLRVWIGFDSAPLRAYYGVGRIMITGAGGSIGSKIFRQVAACRSEVLILFEKLEASFYMIDKELRDGYPVLAMEPAHDHSSGSHAALQDDSGSRSAHPPAWNDGPGERLFEKLVNDHEKVWKTSDAKILMAVSGSSEQRRRDELHQHFSDMEVAVGRADPPNPSGGSGSF